MANKLNENHTLAPMQPVCRRTGAGYLYL